MELQAVGLREASRLLTANGYPISHTTISRQIATGAIPNHGTDEQPRVIVDEVIRSRRANIDQSKQRTVLSLETNIAEEASGQEEQAPAAKREGPTFNHAKTATEAIKAQLLKIELEQKRGTLLDRGATVDAIDGLLRIMRDRMIARHDILASDIAGRKDVAEIRVLLETADRDLLAALVKEFEKIAGIKGEPNAV